MDPLFLTQPLSPSTLLTHLLNPSSPTTTTTTTLLICGLTQPDFLSALTQDPSAEDLLSPPSLAQLSISRHIRTLFIPTVSHLRAYLSVFSIHDSKIPAPHNSSPKMLLAYNVISSHRDTSEWSIQGISNTASALIEAANREGLRAIILDSSPVDLTEKIPVLSGSSKRTLLGRDAAGEAGWMGKTAELNKVIRRWFRIRENLGDL
ncbi:hypothetical protein QBC38DRAFT_356999 [Podospora fimiseda]|uniref:Uncharacterized protein n=1 Tax=Podospora fimiseda TaxID=252190 RepID=A0AAN7BVS7_9PEZI|nr:hypothetical protein QBC38DRAFT_356999 [Podospora fimiseda]